MAHAGHLISFLLEKDMQPQHDAEVGPDESTGIACVCHHYRYDYNKGLTLLFCSVRYVSVLKCKQLKEMTKVGRPMGTVVLKGNMALCILKQG